MKKLLRTLTILILLLLVAGAGLSGAAVALARPPAAVVQDPFFQVSQGESLGLIASRLEERGFIRSRLLLIAYAKLMGTESNLQTGYYRIPGEVSMIEVHDLLLRGRQFLVTVTIPEGYTLRRIAALLDEKQIVAAEEFIAAAANSELLGKLGVPADSAEGYLYPDTYRFALNTPPEQVLEHFVVTFFSELSAVLSESGIELESFTPAELAERIILASIVEREYRLAEEAPLIASVFYNRLDRGMPLQSCATVVYVLTEEQGKEHPSFITYRDLELESPFNTYRRYGLPPAPICNPGRVALVATFFPADSPYLYFLVEDPAEGKHRFTTTLSDHNAAKRLYIKSN